jgi:hypothetical protein
MQSSTGSPTEGLFEVLGRLRTSWPKRGWSWDSRVSCVASSFGHDLMEEARQAAAIAFPYEWTKPTLQSAPPIIRDIAERTGGVRADQRLLATQPFGKLIAYGMWWPWGDEITISLRIGLAGSGASYEEARLREAFSALE